MVLFCKHEKEYFKTRNPKNFVPSKNGTTFQVGGIRDDVKTKEKYFWGYRKAAFEGAEKYFVTPVIVQKYECFQLVWH